MHGRHVGGKWSASLAAPAAWAGCANAACQVPPSTHQSIRSRESTQDAEHWPMAWQSAAGRSSSSGLELSAWRTFQQVCRQGAVVEGAANGRRSQEASLSSWQSSRTSRTALERQRTQKSVVEFWQMAKAAWA